VRQRSAYAQNLFSKEMIEQSKTILIPAARESLVVCRVWVGGFKLQVQHFRKWEKVAYGEELRTS
jgi:hypothetical protein